MATHTYQAKGTVTKNPIEITKEDFAKYYAEAEKRAIVSAGGLAFSEEDRVNLNAMRKALNLDFTAAADLVCTDSKTYARHWQRFHHWDKQIKKGAVNVAPPADEMADRTHKSRRVVRSKARTTDHLPHGVKEQIAQTVVGEAKTHDDAREQLGIVFGSRAEAEMHLQNVCYGLIRLGMTDADGISAQIKKAMGQAQEELRVETEAQRIVREMAAAGITRNDMDRVMELAKALLPA